MRAASCGMDCSHTLLCLLSALAVRSLTSRQGALALRVELLLTGVNKYISLLLPYADGLRDNEKRPGPALG